MKDWTPKKGELIAAYNHPAIFLRRRLGKFEIVLYSQGRGFIVDWAAPESVQRLNNLDLREGIRYAQFQKDYALFCDRERLRISADGRVRKFRKGDIVSHKNYAYVIVRAVPGKSLAYQAIMLIIGEFKVDLHHSNLRRNDHPGLKKLGKLLLQKQKTAFNADAPSTESNSPKHEQRPTPLPSGRS